MLWTQLDCSFVVELENGNEVWKTQLEDELGAKKPMYGFATSPIVADEKLILQTGGKKGALAAFDLKTGDILWQTTTDSIDSQSPIFLEMQDSSCILAAGGKNLSGVDVATGETRFEYKHEGGNGSAMVPVVLPGEKVLLTLDDSFSKAFSVQRNESGGFEINETWQSRSIKNTYNVPVLLQREFVRLFNANPDLC